MMNNDLYGEINEGIGTGILVTTFIFALATKLLGRKPESEEEAEKAVESISDEDRLKLAKEVGLNGDDVEQILTGEQFADAVRQQETIWQQRGIQSVPTFVIGNQGIAGAHPPETLATFIQQAAQA